MSSDSTRNKVLFIVSEVMGVSLSEVNEESSADTIDDWDSMTQMSLILALQDEFKINLAHIEAKRFSKVKTILETLGSVLPKA